MTYPSPSRYEQTAIARVMHFVRDNPNCLATDVRDGLDLTAPVVSRCLSNLKLRGVLVSEVCGESSARRWKLADDDTPNVYDRPICKVVKTWEPMAIPKQGIFAALGV